MAPFPLTIAPSAGFYNSSPVMESTQIAEASLQHCTQQDMIHKSVFHPGDSLPDIFFPVKQPSSRKSSGIQKLQKLSSFD